MSPASALRNGRRKPHALDLAGALAAFQRVPGPPPAEVFFRSALDNCDLPILTPSRASISVMRRGIVQIGSVGDGSFQQRRDDAQRGFGLHRGRARRHARLQRLDTAVGECANATGAPVSSRTPKASATRGLVHPDSVSKIARARSASPRSREWANVSSALHCSSPAVTRDLPAIPRLRESTRDRIPPAIRWSS